MVKHEEKEHSENSVLHKFIRHTRFSFLDYEFFINPSASIVLAAIMFIITIERTGSINFL